MSQRKSIIVSVLSLTFALCVLGTWGLCAIDRRVTEELTILQAKRPYTNSDPLITEADALIISRQALDAAGYPSDQWLPFKDGRTKAPDGRRDEYFARDTVGNGGQFMFRNESRQDWYRDLHVTLHQEGDTLEIYVSRGK